MLNTVQTFKVTDRKINNTVNLVERKTHMYAVPPWDTCHLQAICLARPPDQHPQPNFAVLRIIYLCPSRCVCQSVRGHNRQQLPIYPRGTLSAHTKIKSTMGPLWSASLEVGHQSLPSN